MKVIAVNGSPRKQWNTATLLESALAGAKSAGAETALIHLYDLAFQGCASCFACKRLGGKSYGRCATRDELTPILDELHEADAFILGSPVYLFSETGEMRSCMERLCFQYLRYSDPPASLFPRRIRTGLIYTMNIGEDALTASGLDTMLAVSRGFMERVFGSCEMQMCTDTLQFDDYSKYDNSRFDPEAKKRRRLEAFPLDKERAYEMGRRLAGE